VLQRLRDDEKRLVNAIFKVHAARGTWPTFGEVERALVRDMDVDEVARRLNRRLGLFKGYLQRGDELSLPPHIIELCEGVEEAYGLIVKALPIVLEVYYNKPDMPKLRDVDFRERGWNDDDVRLLGEFLWTVRPFVGGSGKTGNSWDFEIRPNIRKYAAAKDGRDLVRMWRKDWAPKPPSVRELRPHIGKAAWIIGSTILSAIGLYVAGLLGLV
jgi:hypothetical protein